MADLENRPGKYLTPVTLETVREIATRTFPWYTLPNLSSLITSPDVDFIQANPVRYVAGTPDFALRMKGWKEALDLLNWSADDSKKVLRPMIDLIVKGNVRATVSEVLDPPGKTLSIAISGISLEQYMDRVFPHLYHNGLGPFPPKFNNGQVLTWMAKEFPNTEERSGQYL